MLRRRRQHRDGNQLHIEFDYRDPAGTSLHTTTVELTSFSASKLTEAFTAAGFAPVRLGIPQPDPLNASTTSGTAQPRGNSECLM